MPFTTPMAWEAVAYYDGKDGRAALRRPCRRHRARFGSRSTRSSTASRWSATSTGTAASPPNARRARRGIFPAQIDARDIAEGRIDAAYAGRRLPFVDRMKFYRERERHPALQQVPAGLLRRRRHHQGELRRRGPGRPAVAGDAGARHAPRQDGGAEHPLHRLQHGGPGARARQPASAAASCARP